MKTLLCCWLLAAPVILMPQIEEATKLADRDWTTVSLAVFCLVVLAGFTVWTVVRKDRIIKHLAQDKSNLETAWREDLQRAVDVRSEDTRRVEEAMSSAGESMRTMQAQYRDMSARLESLERAIRDLR